MQSSKVSKLFQAVCPQQQDQRHGGRNVACFQRLTRIVVLYNIYSLFFFLFFFSPPPNARTASFRLNCVSMRGFRQTVRRAAAWLAHSYADESLM